jgi:hypothetical protein
MTTAEKIMMYKEKRDFIKNISKAFEARPKGSSVESINYEVYTKYHAVPDIHQFAEYLVVNFVGGAKSVTRVSSNSNMSNFKVLGTLVDGGYYDEIAEYDSLLNLGFTAVPLDED